ncbi:DNA-deoxyinosine glycosylase [Anoxynatronum buryatiense]|uniref:G/U mismatch-specific uracil-DNA glycosylase n=1 Tax=Anoxynatronum buryatiense TaxID=489973 RepID=A0AA45WSI7_9CLOT|nr:DNA-deoxyinosine glycosylase [Anoxynatronum buryatiense]SMP38277.1 G/U mismatch-specific uracil-DNA glycosylase [Anoxynatronum buryatiense]
MAQKSAHFDTVEVVRNRTIRPSTRLETSKSYKIDTRKVSTNNTLIVNIDHEAKPFQKSYKFKGSDVAHRNSISFRVDELESPIRITWSGVTPIETFVLETKSEISKSLETKASGTVRSNSSQINIKTSFAPIEDQNIITLILGTMPGDKSLEYGEYYKNPRNRFWKIIAAITKNDLPETYQDKKMLLLKTNIGVWDVAHTAIRKGSLDRDMEVQEPNDIGSFIAGHKHLKTIVFNGLESEKLYDRFFERSRKIKYVSLPSSSSANAGISFKLICEKWKQILDF